MSFFSIIVPEAISKKESNAIDDEETAIYTRVSGQMFTLDLIRIFKHPRRIAGVVCR